jgi:site-specific DNA recombinase
VRDRSPRCDIHSSLIAARSDAYIDELVIGRLSMPDAAIVLGGPVAGDERDGLHARLDDLSAMFAADEIDGSQLRRGTAELKTRCDMVEARLAAARAASAVANVVLAGDDLRATWEASPAEVRGKVIDALMVVTVLPGARGRKPGGGYFDPALIRIDWKIADFGA